MHQTHSLIRPLIWLGPILGLLVAGCIHTPKVTSAQLIDYAATQVQNARHHYVQDYDPETLKQAEEKIDAARKAAANDKPDRAKALVQEAELSVQLAELHAKAARTTANRKHVERQIKTLQQDPHQSRTVDAPMEATP